jgi:hypothetical protein
MNRKSLLVDNEKKIQIINIASCEDEESKLSSSSKKTNKVISINNILKVQRSGPAISNNHNLNISKIKLKVNPN